MMLLCWLGLHDWYVRLPAEPGSWGTRACTWCKKSQKLMAYSNHTEEWVDIK